MKQLIALEILKIDKYGKGMIVSKDSEFIIEAIKELENLSGSKQLVDNHTCEGCKYGKFGADSIGIELECYLSWDCSRGRIDKWESKE